MNVIQNKIVSTVMLQLNPGTIVSESMITVLVQGQIALLPITDPGADPLTNEQIEEIIAELQVRLSIRMDRGSCIKEKNHVPWYMAAKGKLGTDFWERYRTYLFKYAGFNADVINSLDVSTDEMMDLLSNPRAGFDFQRRGLVIGDVQSGKTSNYIALMNKAADAKYRVFILLTGTVEKLRRQTQGRVDEGFVGLDSTAFNRDKSSVSVGVGEINQTVSGWSVTSTSSDFTTATGARLSGKLASINSPIVFVLKKNKSVLEKLENWLRIFNASPITGKIDLPLLMIDDEADNASVNTKGNDDPTAINKYIRKILSLFSKASYVGFTATPFANIFIDPDSTEEMLDDDLFPRDFIYALEAPTNYIGASSIFPRSGKYHFMLHDNADCEKYVPLKHKKTWTPGTLPESMCKAIASFMIANAVRDLRGYNKKHRTMMINISIYIDVQKKIAEQIDAYVREIQREIRNYYLMGDVALQYTSFALLKEVYDSDFASTEFTWNQIQKALNEAVAPIVVRYVNGGNAAKTLNYDELDENEGQDGLRVIAVGGFSLSRGLTLEGLCTSYFHRNTKMYDTLMQMGRWFGYRPKYDDLCSVWINEDAIEWYRYISEASEELKREVRRMQWENRTPKDFGLCVRSDEATLLVTARNKMKTAQNYVMTVSLSGTFVETPFINSKVEIIQSNYTATQNLIETIEKKGFQKVINDTHFSLHDKPQYFDIPKSYILDYLRAYQNHSMNSRFDSKALIKMIDSDEDGSLDYWDIAIASGKGSLIAEVGTNRLKCVERSFAIKSDYHAYQMSGSKSRLGNRSYARAGLTAIDAQTITKKEQELNQLLHGEERPLNQDVFLKTDYINSKRKPVLVIYPVQLKYDHTDDGTMDINKRAAVDNCVTPLIGISVGVPRIKGVEIKRYQYKINIIKYRELMDIDNSDIESDESIEE